MKYLPLLQEQFGAGIDSDVVSLLSAAEEAYDTKYSVTSSLDEWLPSREAILEALENTPAGLIQKEISNFRDFAKSKEWTVRDRLDNRFIVHCKIRSGK
jgi:hypothetical protein